MAKIREKSLGSRMDRETLLLAKNALQKNGFSGDVLDVNVYCIPKEQLRIICMEIGYSLRFIKISKRKITHNLLF